MCKARERCTSERFRPCNWWAVLSSINILLFHTTAAHKICNLNFEKVTQVSHKNFPCWEYFEPKAFVIQSVPDNRHACILNVACLLRKLRNLWGWDYPLQCIVIGWGLGGDGVKKDKLHQVEVREGCPKWKSKWKFKMVFAIRRRPPPPPPFNGTNFQTFFTPLFFFCNWILHIWNGFYTSKISLSSPLIIGSKLTFISSTGRWLPTI